MPRKRNNADIAARLNAIHISVVEHFDTNYGKNEAKLESWQRLCRDIGVQEGPSVTQCKKHLKGIYVNIFDFVHAQEADEQVQTFASAKALAEYTRETGRIFPLVKAKKSPMLKWMLVPLRL